MEKCSEGGDGGGHGHAFGAEMCLVEWMLLMVVMSKRGTI